MPHANKLVLCVDIRNTLKLLMPHAHNLVMCVDIVTPTSYIVWLLKIPLTYSKYCMPTCRM